MRAAKIALAGTAAFAFAAPAALAQYADLSAATHLGPVDSQLRDRHAPEPRRDWLGDLAERGGGRT